MTSPSPSSSLPRVAWIGLGIMGLPMASNLLKAGYEVVGHTLEPAGLERLAAVGGTPTASVAAAVRGADVVVTMLPASPEVEAVAYGERGVLAHAARGTLFVDMSSVTPRTSVELAEAAARKGIRVLDAPVSGGEAGAVEGVLSIMAGGERADFERALPLFRVLGTTVVLCGPHGAGQTVKAANQLIVAANIQACAEAVVFLEKSGVNLEAALDVLGGGLAGSAVLSRKRHNFLSRHYPPGFRIDLHHKDMGIVTDAARAVGAAVPVGALVASLVAAARAQGDGGLDHSALLRGVERLSGIGRTYASEEPSGAGRARR
ncbi:2-hydroxy-3-oxopropionate reductase [Streptomyces roseifaciens]